MNPVELLLSSIASCQTITALIFADFYGIKIDDIQVEVEGSLDPDGFSGMDPTVRPGFQNIRSTFHIKSSAPKGATAAAAEDGGKAVSGGRQRIQRRDFGSACA